MIERGTYNKPYPKDEWRALPEEAGLMTFRGRYNHVDNGVMSLIRSDRIPKGTPIHVLDFAGGILPFGSPTAHDLFEVATMQWLTPRISVVDKLPDNLQPSNPEIHYKNSLDEVSGPLDIVRALHVEEHIKQEEYTTLREQLVAKIRDGGLLVTTQRLLHPIQDEINERIFGSIIKIMQKRDEKLLPVALYPDRFIPKPEDEVPLYGLYAIFERHQQYREYRNQIANGEIKIRYGFSRDTFERMQNALQKYPKEILQYETDQILYDQGRLQTTEPYDLNAYLIKNAKDVEQHFQVGLKRS